MLIDHDNIPTLSGVPMHMPLVSIITPVFNGIKYIDLCITSVLQQSYQHIEHIIIDGGSDDGTIALLSKYSAEYPHRIRLISERDNGWGDAVNKGIKIANGVIVGIIGSDDIYERDAIQTVAEFFLTNPDAYVLSGGCIIINEIGSPVFRQRTRDFNLKEVINGPPMVITGPSVFFKTEVFHKVGLYGSEVCCDFDFAIRVGQIFSVYRIEKVLANFRAHKDSLTGGSWKNRKKSMREICMISRRYGGSIFSRYHMMYYAFIIIDLLRPVLGSIYPFVSKVTGKNIGKSKEDWEIPKRSPRGRDETN